MSVSFMSDVWRYSKAKGSTLLVAIALADRANDAGESWESVATLARKVRMSERSVQYALRELCDMAELEVAVGAGPHGCNLCRLLPVLPASVGGANFAPGANPGAGGVQTSAKGGANACTRDVRETINKDKGEARVKPLRAPKVVDTTPLPELPAWVPPAAWAGWVEMREVAKDPVTANIAALAIKKLDKLRAAGSDPEEVLEQSTLSKWIGLFPVKGRGFAVNPGESPATRRARLRHTEMSGGLVAAKDPALMPQRLPVGPAGPVMPALDQETFHG
jgi:hypothetical protein